MSDEAEKAISAEADARYPRLTADGMRANRAFVAGAVWGRAEVAELVHQRGKLLDIAQEANDDCKGWRSLLAARDALVESQERQIEALTGSIQDINTGWDETLGQLAERDAVIERVLIWLSSFGDPPRFPAERKDLQALVRHMAASPSTVLAEHDAEKWEEGWDDFSAGIEKWDNPYRKGAGQ